ncbi:hypothetical protein H5T55_06265 [Candidatus Bipolaricaulota bacterium]|nr:hypothetical protein [Candidatus Bipolaricaulota bacterium]
MLEVVNLIVGLLAIGLSITAVALSIIYSSKASSTLDAVKDKADAIERDVRDRLDDLVRRAAPSEQERAMSAVLPELLKGIMADPETLRLLLQKAIEGGRDKSP